MKLTDKTLQAFNKQNYDNDFGYIDHEPTSLVVHFEDLDENLQNSIIVDFFDSVDIYIIINFIAGDFDFEIKDYYTNKTECKRFYGTVYETRLDATEKAIIHANNLYNETTSNQTT